MHIHARNKIIPTFFATLIVCFVSFVVLFGLIDNVQGAETPPAPAAKPGTSNDSSWMNLLGLDTLGHRLGTIILSLAAGFTWAGGSLLDWSMRLLVLNMSTQISSTGMGNAINSTWAIVRDFANLIFIFGFIYIGIKTILDYESSDTKRMLVAIITGALLINFSLFFTKVIIDASNLLAVEIHKSMAAPNKEIALAFSEQLGITGIYNSPNPQKFLDVTKSGTITFYVLGAVFLMVTGFVFAAGAFLIITRFVLLVLIMIFSPVLFAFTVFGKTQDVAKDLWKKLLSQAFFAPAYLFLLLISFRLIEGTKGLGVGGDKFSTALTGEQGAFGVILNFTIIIIFIVASLVISQKMGAVGASQAIKIGKKMAGTATAGLAAAAFRSTAGRLGNKLMNSEKLQDKAANNWLARQTLRASAAASGASFDARQVGGVGNTLGVGEGKKGGYTARLDAARKREEEMAKLLGQVGDDDAAVMARKREVEDMEKKLRAARARRDAETDPGLKALAADEVAKVEKELAKAEDRVEQEKNRRIIGSSFNPKGIQPDIDRLNEVISRAQESITTASRDYLNAGTDALRTGAEARIKSLQEAIEKAKSEQMDIRRKAGVPTGYSDVIENSGKEGFTPIKWTTVQVQGRNKGINRTVGKELRKKYSKKIKGDDGAGKSN